MKKKIIFSFRDSNFDPLTITFVCNEFGEHFIWYVIWSPDIKNLGIGFNALDNGPIALSLILSRNQ